MERGLPDNLREKIDELGNKYLQKRIFTACCVGFFSTADNEMREDFYVYGAAGRAGREKPLDTRGVFDLASLTKPLVTSLCLLSLIEEGRCHLEDRLDKFFYVDSSSDKKTITLDNLLTHSSGLPAHRPFYKSLIHVPEDIRKQYLVNRILAEQILFIPGTDTLYSDLGFMLLGQIVEIVSGQSLDEYWERTIIQPLQLDNSLFFAAKKKTDTQVCVPTGNCLWSNMPLCGLVHDDNCRALGGVAGHAGLFGTIRGVLALCKELLLQYTGDSFHPAYSRETLTKMFNRKNGSWIFGFDTPTPPLSSSGKYFSARSIGHLGFTGTSFWIDLEKGRGIVLLTNRVFCGESLTAIKKFRPLLHDTIIENLITPPGQADWSPGG